MEVEFVPSGPLETAVLFLVFNRPDTTAEVFSAIRKARPARLYVSCDGPRAGSYGEATKVELVRKIVTAVDWPCEVETMFHDENLGCKVAVSHAIDWFFDQEDCGIILEDDCLPSHSFFWFCQDMLRRYEGDPDVMAVAGTNIVCDLNLQESYFFSIYPLMWGWATWARAWKLYDRDLKNWPLEREKGFPGQVQPGNVKFRLLWQRIFQHTFDRGVDTWDFQWIYCCWMFGGLTVAPSVNLVSNLGFSKDATHTTNPDTFRSNLPTREISWPLIGPAEKCANERADQFIAKYWFGESWRTAIKSRLLLVPAVATLNRWIKKRVSS